MNTYKLDKKPTFISGQIVKATHNNVCFDCEILGIASKDIIDIWIVKDIKNVISPNKTYPFEVFVMPHTSFVME